MDKPFQFLNMNLDTGIPIPNAVKEKPVVEPTAKPVQSVMGITPNRDEKKLVKYEREYDAYCRWIATPEQERHPKSVGLFETKWKIPKTYSSSFRTRGDFKQKVIGYWYEWLLDKWPTIAYSAYEQAKKGNSAHIKIFADLMAKHLDTEKPKATIQPFMIVGVPQEKINKLFIPDDIQEVVINGEEAK